MRPSYYAPRPAFVLSTLASVAVLATPAFAQDSKQAGDNATPSSGTPPASTADESQAEQTPSPTSNDNSPTPTPGDNASTAKDTKASSTPDSSSKDASITAAAPTAPGADGSAFPTLTGQPVIPTYPAPSVPPTKNAPFMQQSSMPDGTVFIAVGSILGAFGLAILLWRAIVSFLLHRSVERASVAQTGSNSKAGFPAPPAPFYKYTDEGSNMSVPASGRGVRRTNRGPIPSATPSQSNLFFSPTAAATTTGGAGSRNSAFLPSGFYAANSGSPGPNHQQSYSMTNLRPDSQGYFRSTTNGSPPDSPQLSGRRDMSTSSINLSQPPVAGQRAPSAYLEDLLADDPSSFPPPHMPPSTGPRRSSGYGNRNSSPQSRF